LSRHAFHVYRKPEIHFQSGLDAFFIAELVTFLNRAQVGQDAIVVERF